MTLRPETRRAVLAVDRLLADDRALDAVRLAISTIEEEPTAADAVALISALRRLTDRTRIAGERVLDAVDLANITPDEVADLFDPTDQEAREAQ